MFWFLARFKLKTNVFNSSICCRLIYMIIFCLLLSSDAKNLQWKLCKIFRSNSAQVLDIQFGMALSGLKAVSFKSSISFIRPITASSSLHQYSELLSLLIQLAVCVTLISVQYTIVVTVVASSHIFFKRTFLENL